jgi:CheY-like chemotaxis protein/nitrogen-specific signal transduction histidine kinase
MKRIYLFLSVIILLLVLVNIFYYVSVYRQQVEFQKNMLMKQTEICSWEIEMHISEFLNEMNFILYTEDVSIFFSDPYSRERSIRKIEAFFSKYNSLITGISIYDDKYNVYNIFRDRGNRRITDTYVSREQRILDPREKVEQEQGESVFTFPVFRENAPVANVIVRIDKRKYIEAVFSAYHIDNTVWQWLLNNEGEIFYSTFQSGSPDIQGIKEILAFRENDIAGASLSHRVTTREGRFDLISTWYPIRIFNQDFTVIFSLNSGIVVRDIIKSAVYIAAATFVILILIILFFLYFLRNELRQKDSWMKSERAIKEILESLPVGIIIKGEDGRVKNVNSTALEILKIEDPGKIIRKDISGMFFLLRDYAGASGNGSTGNTSEFVYYDSGEEQELILYKKEIPLDFSGEKVTVEAFIDISPIEKARKSQFLWGEAKTEFLKRVSHDIRNPLNAIQNMTDLLEADTDPGSPEKEKLGLIRNCCEDIHSVVNDIIDFSGFDPDKVSVEEIPFDLRDEVNLVVNSVSNKAKKNNVDILVNVDDNIPANLIGDPFHIKQVLIKLLSNSITHTDKGEIRLNIRLKRQVSGNVLLEFVVEDTGKGIPQTILEKLNLVSGPGLVPGGSPGLNKTRQIIDLMKGEMLIESPFFTDGKKGKAGTRVTFTVQVFSNEFNAKNLNFDHIKGLSDIKALVLAEDFQEKPCIVSILGELQVPCELTRFNDLTIELLKSRDSDTSKSWSLIFIIDSTESNGFSIARKLHENNLAEHHLIIVISLVNKTGNFMKSRRFGADYYLIGPCEKSEIVDIINRRFSQISKGGEIEVLSHQVTRDLKILVAEDNKANQIVARSLFKRLGHDIDLAANGREAINKVREKEYDIVFMDIRMPEKNGLDAAHEIRMMGYKMPIVAMTANAGEDDKTQALEAGMNNYLSKPVNINVLKNILLKLVSRSSPV